MSVSTEDKLLARTAISVFGGKPSVARFWDDAHVSFVDIVTCVNSPWSGIASYATVGVSKSNIGYTSEDTPLRIELVGACDMRMDLFPNILATCGFNIINSGFACHPGAIFRDIVHLYDKQTELKHILFVSPFLWEDKLKTVTLTDKKVAWLLIVPISDVELQYASEHSTEQLESLFEEQQINIFDLYRPSIEPSK
jgi:hypothetical protein